MSNACDSLISPDSDVYQEVADKHEWVTLYEKTWLDQERIFYYGILFENLKSVGSLYPLLVSLSFVPTAFSCIAYLEGERPAFWIIMALHLYCSVYLLLLAVYLGHQYYTLKYLREIRIRKAIRNFREVWPSVMNKVPPSKRLSESECSARLQRTSGILTGSEDSTLMRWSDEPLTSCFNLLLFSLRLVHGGAIFIMTVSISIGLFFFQKNDTYDDSARGQMLYLVWLMVINGLVGYASVLLSISEKKKVEDKELLPNHFLVNFNRSERRRVIFFAEHLKGCLQKKIVDLENESEPKTSENDKSGCDLVSSLHASVLILSEICDLIRNSDNWTTGAVLPAMRHVTWNPVTTPPASPRPSVSRNNVSAHNHVSSHPSQHDDHSAIDIPSTSE
ncbi:hypothetical protein DM01DRAFT_1334451 [Hesseltinella vesiculosa]|uniref:Uncharacterized protein n=1 Tax=Hesseltinella vesiculosa TaxID=101127 RepID=A0A1X2GLW6_9FUNG|nr:hypothetical protein DM01DRAFT_1334451 [Hesseltinella vesiculosa]